MLWDAPATARPACSTPRGPLEGIVVIRTRDRPQVHCRKPEARLTRFRVLLFFTTMSNPRPLELGAATPTSHSMRKLKHNVRNPSSVTRQLDLRIARKLKLLQVRRRGRKAAAHIKDALRHHPDSLPAEDQIPENRPGGLVGFARRALRLV